LRAGTLGAAIGGRWADDLACGRRRAPGIASADQARRNIQLRTKRTLPLRAPPGAPRLEGRVDLMSDSAPELSIIIPSFNEELRLSSTLEKIARYVERERRSTEVIVVDDGSTDRTAEVAESFRGKLPELRVLANGTNRGKGYSVRHGSLEARGEKILFTDADLSSPIEEAGKLLVALKDHDVAIGSRALDRRLIEVRESAFREFAGIIFNKIVRIVLRLPFVDTQCGFKAFRREPCRVIFEQQTIERFGFDPELLYLARHHGLSTVEVPVRWAHSPATKVSMMRYSVQMFLDVVIIRWNALRGRYRKAPSAVLYEIKYLTTLPRTAILGTCPPPAPSALPPASPYPLTPAPRITSATSAKPWNALPNSLPCPAGAVWPWALRPWLRRSGL